MSLPWRGAASIFASVGLYLAVVGPVALEAGRAFEPADLPTPPANPWDEGFVAIELAAYDAIAIDGEIAEPTDDEAPESEADDTPEAPRIETPIVAEAGDGGLPATAGPVKAKRGKPRPARPTALLRDRPKKKATARKPCPEPTPGIVAHADHAWTVPRAIVEYYATHVNALMSLGWVSPHEDADGRPDGFRVGFGRCGVLADVGLKSGDIVHRINGRKVNGVMQAVATYFALRDEDTIVVELTRRRQPLTLTYHLDGDLGDQPGLAKAIKEALREEARDEREARRERKQARRDERRDERLERKEARRDRQDAVAEP